jgi:hypothetical protein
MKYYIVRVYGNKKSIPLPYEVNEHVVYTCKITKEGTIILSPEEPFKKF